ncbi:SMC-Scp complex subunit ScpB [Pseudomonadota bacterium]
MSEKIEQLKSILEAALLAAGEPLTMVKILALFPEDAEPAKEDLLEALDSLQQDCESRGVELKKIGKAWRYQSKEQYAPWLRRLSESRPPRYSRALLETLAIIAYRQPVTRGDIEEIRGVSVSTDILRTLQNREWVKQVGHRDVPGHPGLYGTTKEFLGYFNLGSLTELPPLPEKRDSVDIAEELNIRLPLTISGGDDKEQSSSDVVTDIEQLIGSVVETDDREENESRAVVEPPDVASSSEDAISPDTLQDISVAVDPQETEPDLVSVSQTQPDG